MAQYNFNQRKNSILKKQDKSSIGNWDKKIVLLCNKINYLDDFYTTSSCSGRAMVMVDQEKKSERLFIETSHEKISFEWLKEKLEEISKNPEYSKKTIKFKTESPILHIVAKTPEKVSELLEKAKHSGFKRSGINALRKNILLELISTEKIEFPIIWRGRILVDDEFLKLITEQTNQKLERGWKKIEKLEKQIQE